MIICNRPRIYDVDLYGAALTLGIALIAYAALLQPLQTKTLQSQRQHLDASKRRGATQQRLTAMQASFQQQNALALRLASMPDVLAQSKGLDDVIGRIDLLSNQYAVSLDNVIPNEPASTQHHTITPLELKLSGSFRETMSLLNSITQNMPYIHVDNISINSSNENTAICDIALELHVFSY